MNLTLAPNPIYPSRLIAAAHFLSGLPFAEEGHRCSTLPKEEEGPHFVEGQGDCVFYLFHTLGIAGLWPDEWNTEGQIPIELRRVRMTYGSRLSTLDDFPVIREFLEANGEKVEGAPKDGDLVLMRWGQRQGAPHHVALWAGEGFYHLPFGGISGWQATDATWNKKIVEIWRLSAVIQP